MLDSRSTPCMKGMLAVVAQGTDCRKDWHIMHTDNEAGVAGKTNSTPYGIKRHHHLFAAWAASRAASVRNCRFSVKQGRTILEASGFTADFSKPEQLPTSKNMDMKHRQWRTGVIEAAKSQGLVFTDGVAAKLINCYLKSRFVCGGHSAHSRVHNLHPPIDRVLLNELIKLNLGGHLKKWRQAGRTKWSKFNSEK